MLPLKVYVILEQGDQTAIKKISQVIQYLRVPVLQFPQRSASSITASSLLPEMVQLSLTDYSSHDLTIILIFSRLLLKMSAHPDNRRQSRESHVHILKDGL